MQRKPQMMDDDEIMNGLVASFGHIDFVKGVDQDGPMVRARMTCVRYGTLTKEHSN